MDWARQVKAIADHPRYRQAERLIRVCDNLNTHAYASFYRAFPPAEARRLAQRVQRVFTPRPRAPQGRTGTERPDAPGPVPAQVPAWTEARNVAQKGIYGQFRTANARMPLKHLYPTI